MTTPTPPERCSGGDCVEVELNEQSGRIWLWSNRRPEEVARIDADEWADFLARVKNGEFDQAAPTR